MRTVSGARGTSGITPVVGAGAAGRRRRPSGELPPLPRHVAVSTICYAVLFVGTLGFEALWSIDAVRRWITRLDDFVLDGMTAIRNGATTHVLHVVEQLGSPNALRLFAWATIAVLLVSRRLRHLITYLVVLLIAVTLTGVLTEVIGRMRPTGAALIGPWQGYSHPSAPVAVLAAALVGMSYTLVPGGRWRRRATAVAAVLVALLCLARLYLGVDHPTDQLAALGIGWAGVIVAFRLLTPEEVFPVRYRRGPTAHLDLTAERCDAISRALSQQLGIRAESLEPFGLGASAGSTPLCIQAELADGSKQAVFGKLYALNHLRSDRSYKLARMMLYGRLEDEKPFSSVRRLAEYEDHMLRLLRDSGLPVPTPYGFVEITPEREYLIVMSFVAGAHDLGDRQIGTAEIDSALRIVRRLWQAGVAHRDIKPSNLLEHDGKVELIDVAFATVRPTPWRQAVDLANMMLTLALVSDAALVYERALRLFAPDDIAEAFAACRSITIPTQLRRRLRNHRPDLVAQFRELAPHRPPVRIQVWNMRRALVTASVVTAAVLAIVLMYVYARTAGLL